ncbi:MAG: hypothetical protein DBX47_03880 [Clostridiales bacterium]|nr:MAG: hypothetical protein DBX47_03880 [Clostridiales bacterium]
MRIIFLGTSHGTATPNRFNSSSLICSGDSNYLVDAGEPVGALMIRQGLDINNIRAVFITHMHGDHVCGLINLIKLFVKYPKTKHFIYLPEDCKDGILSFMKVIHIDVPNDIVEFRITKEGSIYTDDNISVSSFPTRHVCIGDVNAGFGYTFYADNKKLMYTGDINQSFLPFLESNEHYDACVFEGTHYEPAPVLEKLEKCKFDRLFINHIREEWHDNSGVEFAKKHFFDKLPYPVEIVFDGEKYII